MFVCMYTSFVYNILNMIIIINLYNIILAYIYASR